MQYINYEILDKIDIEAYQNKAPFPYISITDVLYEDAYTNLVQTAPDISLFERQYGKDRYYGQRPHNKYFLLYSTKTPLADVWKEFIAELNSERYLKFVETIFNIERSDYNLELSWHYMMKDSSISPHCDGERKVGSQLFYLNTPDTWNEEWGGQTLALDDMGERDYRSNPEISDFTSTYKSKSVGNNSFIFTRTNHSWHAVDVLRCPDSSIRKMFSVVINRKPTLREKMKSYIKKNFQYQRSSL